MSGKAYTMNEMKMIVDYLVEHKAYGEIRGRKMWMDFANAKVVNRTWQSLKETFLKRILPDIQNPYYKLTLIQIASFRQGSDVEAKLNNKLDIEPVDKSNSENDQLIVNEDVEEENEKEPTETSKATRDSKLVGDRTSTDTLVLENCYKTAEDIQKELEKSDNEENEANTQNEAHNVVKDVINDFTSDNETDELKQTKKATQKGGEIGGNNETIEISDSEDRNANLNHGDKSSDKSPGPLKIVEDENNEDLAENDKSKENPKNTSDSILNGNESKNETKQQSKEKPVEQDNESKRTSGLTQNTTSTTVDTQLPNNQEGLNKLPAKERASKVQLSLKNDKKRNKRATSQEAPKTKRKKIEQQASVSDTDMISTTNDLQTKNGIDKNVKSTEQQEQSMIQDAQVVNLDSIPENGQAKGETTNDKDISGDIKEISGEKSCEKNVSLYAKQLSYTIYSDSGNSIEQTDTSKQQTSNIPNAQPQILDMNSDSGAEGVKPKTKSNLRIIEKKRRNNALAHAFGFSNDVLSSRKRRRSYNRKRSISRHKTLHISSGTSDYTSESESEFISPPRGRKNRGTRKYLKPKSARILSLEEEGGLFVMHGKKIYPIIKDGKILKNYLTYTPDDESGKEESYWKLKYVQEKKKADELAKLLKQAIGTNKAIEDRPATEKIDLEDQKQSSSKNIDAASPVPTTSDNRVSESKEERTVKIKFTKNNEEVQLEGHWNHINPVLEQVVQMLNKNSKEEIPESNKNETKDNRKRGKSSVQNVPEPETIVANGNEANRVNKIESEIFKEIEEIDKAETGQTYPTEGVNKRRAGRPRKAPVEKPTESPKRAKLSIDTEKETENKKDAPTTRRSTRTPKKIIDENTSKTTSKTTASKKLSPRKAQEKDSNGRDVTEDDDVKYKFPSPRARRAAQNSYAIDTTRVESSPENPSHYSEETTQGYIDSDISPVCYRKKRRCSILTRKLPGRFRKKSTPNLNEITSESSCSFVTAPLKSKTFTNSSVSSHIYRSESYQLLMPNARNSPKRLTKIDELSPPPKDSDFTRLETQNFTNNNDENVKNLNATNDMVDYSSLTLPTSPVLSIVEHISINKSMLSSMGENSLDGHENYNNKITLNELMTSGLADVSMPLMEQNYAVEKKGKDGSKYHYTLNPQEPAVSDSLVNKICTVKIDDITLSDSLSTKLRDLLIESAKKFGKKIFTIEDEMKTVTEEVEPEQNVKKAKTKKRSSTPRKRKNVPKSKPPCEPFVEEEYTEQCSKSGRKSCPPVMTVCEEFNKNPQTAVDPQTTNVSKREKKKKDIIKVKITRPTKRSLNTGCVENNEDSANENTTNDTESGIFLQGLNDTVDLIHNHSETCLQAHECILNNSVELVQNPKSVISIDSNDTDKEYNHIVNVDEKIALELLGTDAQDASELFKDIDSRKSNISETPSISLPNTASRSTPNSLITEDLSVNESSPKPSNWYFFSEEESTNYVGLPNSDPNNVGYGANLNQIFPITCAVPNLSTITEISNENTNSKKINIDESLRNELFSQSFF